MDAIDVARFWSKVDVGHVSHCWPWKSGKSQDGYGSFMVNGKSWPTHRLALNVVFGTQLEGVVVRHRCDNPSCCNPYHLGTGSHAENVADRVARDRSARGERNGRAKLTDDKVRQIRSDARTTVAIAKDYGLTPASVSNIKNGRTWVHVN